MYALLYPVCSQHEQTVQIQTNSYWHNQSLWRAYRQTIGTINGFTLIKVSTNIPTCGKWILHQKGKRFPDSFFRFCLQEENSKKYDLKAKRHFLRQTQYTLIRKSPRWCVFTQAWGYIVITSYLSVFKFACVISQGFGLLLNKLYYYCMS